MLPKDRPDKAAVIQLCEAAALEEMLLEYVSLISGRSKTADLGSVEKVPPDSVRARELGQAIRELVLDPLNSWTTQAKHLVLVTDGLLSRLPFSALPVDDGYVIDKWLISYLHTARDLFGSDDIQAPPSSPLVISGPVYDWPGSIGRGNFRFQWLDGATAEGEAIAKMLGVTPVTHARATKQALAMSRAPEILHIATHGMMLPARPSTAELGPLSPLVWSDLGELRLHIPGTAVLNPGLGRLSERQLPDQALRSILVLAGANTWLNHDPLPLEAGNGLVTADDIAAMDLAGNRLTVLSACETGLGVIGVGEGVLGLSSSFAIAGAETVVTSLWSVDDASTKDLMCALYGNVIRGMGRAAALHEAQKALRDQYPDDPYFWAPFICHGAPGPLRDSP